MRMLCATLLGAATLAFLAGPATAQVEDAMTPTPTPKPGVSPIPNYPEKGGGNGQAAKIRIDRSGMFGAGILVGNTVTGATAKFWASPEVSIQGAFGVAPLGNDYRFRLDVLYSWYRWQEPGGTYILPFYVGVGVQYGVFSENPYPSDGNELGFRIPVGMSVVIPDNPVELFFEAAPDFGSYHYNGPPSSDHGIVYVDGELGVRYYF